MIWTATNSKLSRIGYAALYKFEADSFDNSRLWRTAKGRLWGCGNGLLFQIERNFWKNAKLWPKPEISINVSLLLANAKLQKFIYLKIFNQHTTISNSHRNKDNEQSPFLNATCPCELAVWHPIFEKQRSCVCTTATLSHRFKTSEKVGRTTYRYRDESRKYHEKT